MNAATTAAAAATAERARPDEASAAVEDLSATALIDLILATHHAYARKVLGRAAALAPAVVARHGERDPRLAELAGAVDLLAREMESHMLREEAMLFPIMREVEADPDSGECEAAAMLGPLMCMKREHGFIDEMMARCRSLTDDYASASWSDAEHRALLDALRGFESDTGEHVRKEEDILFRKAMRMIPPVR